MNWSWILGARLLGLIKNSGGHVETDAGARVRGQLGRRTNKANSTNGWVDHTLCGVQGGELFEP